MTILSFNITSLVQTAGYFGIFGIIFAESGLFLGFFLPGDSLLFTAGLLASQGYLDIIVLSALTFIAAAGGDSFGYYFGKKIGPKIFVRHDSIILSPDHVKRAEDFYEKHGPKTIVLARFMPVIRTFAPILAGVGNMRYLVFLSYNLIGALIWAIGIPFLGYYLGATVPNIDAYFFPIIGFILLSSIFPTLIHLIRDKEHRTRVFAAIRRWLHLGN